MQDDADETERLRAEIGQGVASPSSAISLNGKLSDFSPACMRNAARESMAGRDSPCQKTDRVNPVPASVAGLKTCSITRFAASGSGESAYF